MHGDVNLCGGGRGLDAGATVPGKHSPGSVVAHKRPVRVYAFTAARGPRIYIHVRSVSGCRIATFSVDPVRRLQVIKLPFSCIMHRFLRKCLSDPSQLYLSLSLLSSLYISLDPLLPLPPHPRLEFSSIARKQGSGIPETKLGKCCHQLYQDPLQISSRASRNGQSSRCGWAGGRWRRMEWENVWRSHGERTIRPKRHRSTQIE